MEIEKVKEKMKAYTDYFGGSLNHVDIDSAKTLQDLYEVLELHNSTFSDMATDAERNLDRFRRNIGLHMEPEKTT